MTNLSTVFLLSAIAATGGANVASAANLTIMAGELPPMIMADGTGREVEIITEVMSRCGHEVTFKVQPFTRHWKSYEAGTGDAVTTVPQGMPLPGGQSQTYIQYQNGVSNLEDSGASFTDLGSLSDHTVIAFMGASDILPGLKAATESFKSYKEAADQIVQSRMIFAQRVDAVIGDGMIFAEFNRQLRDDVADLPFDPMQNVRFQATFDPSNYTMNFRDASLAADFDRCFSAAEADGTIAQINKTWVEKYRDTLGSQYLGY